MSITVIIACCIGAFALGIGFLYATLKLSVLHNNKKKKSRTTEATEEKKKIGTMDIILIIIGISAFIFTVTMIWIFIVQGDVPDTLITCFFAFIGGECGIMGLIQNTKKKQKNSEKDEEAKG
ncbi:MAG: hypothetical protein IJ385_06315 [Ruminiclostridium sp.]|nr:hypothetical protein [Ruminiclostridium sp.]